MGIFLIFQEYVDEGKHYQAKMEEIKGMVEMESHKCPWKILEMSSYDKECYSQACDRCAKRGKYF